MNLPGNRYLDHGWGGGAIDSKTWQERLARTMGQLANVTMGLMILPVLRNGVFEKVRRFSVRFNDKVASIRVPVFVAAGVAP